MAKPNSRFTRFRRNLVRVIDPYPPPGEGWCMDCSLLGGRTAVLNVDSIHIHLKSHDPDEKVSFRGMRMPHAG